MLERRRATLSGERCFASAFHRPDAAHSPAAYWFWHQLPAPDQIRRQIRDLRKGGFRTVLIQCRLAFPRHHYLDDRYLAAYSLAVKEARLQGLQVGIYDDYNWQSGLAGGRTVQGANHLREQHIFWVTGQAISPRTSLWLSDIRSSVEDLGETAMSWQYEDGRVDWTDWTIVAALLYPARNARPDSIEDVTARARIGMSSPSGCRIDLSLPPQVVHDRVATVFVTARSSTSRVPNYLLKETALRFIEVGYEPFRATLSEYFGNTVEFFFFDQPHFSFYRWPAHHGNLLTSLPFAPELAGCAEAATGQSFGLTLLALVEEAGPDTGTIRANFYEAFSRLVTSHFLGTLKKWTAQHGVGLSGHEVLGHVGSWHPHGAFPHWDLRVNFGLDYFGVDTYRTMTGVDAQGLRPQLSAKMGDSVSRSHGRTGCTVEQYFVRSGATGSDQFVGRWELSLEELRAQAFRLHLSGAKQFLVHAYYQSDGNTQDPSLLRNPRFDFAPGVNFEPWWPFHHAFAKESARLSTFLDAASPVLEVAIFYPLRTAWAEGPAHSYGAHIAFWAQFLSERGYGFHFIDEQDLLSARFEHNALCIGDRTYPLLVLPSVSTLAAPTSLGAVEQFLKQGGTVIASGDTPVRYQHQEGVPAAVAWDKLVSRYSGLRCLSEIPSPAEVEPFLRPLLGKRPYPASLDPDLFVWQWVGTDAYGWRLALFNDRPESVRVAVKLPSPVDKLEIWDVSSADITPKTITPTRELQLRLDPMQLVCLRLGGRTDDVATVDTMVLDLPTVQALLQTAETYPLSTGWTLSVDGGATVIDPVDVTLPWEKQGLAEFSGIGTYVHRFDVAHLDGHWWLHLPSLRAAVMVELNGVTIGKRAWAPYIVALPTNLLQRNHNTLRLHVFNTAANRYLIGTPYRLADEASGLLGVPRLLRQHSGPPSLKDRPIGPPARQL